MNIIHRKVRVVAAPVFVGTRVSILVTEDSPVWGFKTANIATGSARVLVDWGDGSVDAFTENVRDVTHAYAVPGRYEVCFSDDLASFALSAKSGVHMRTYGPMIAGVWSNARKLDALLSYAFGSCANLTEIDFKETRIRAIPEYCFFHCASLVNLDNLPVGLVEICKRGFCNCEQIEVARFPNVVSVGGTGSLLAFSGCTALREIHFAEANKEALLASEAFQDDPEHLGAPNATVMFDL